MGTTINTRARAFFGEVDPAHRQKMRHDKEES
jgi:hypothetical protein